MNNYQKQLPCTYGYKLVCVDDKFRKPFKTYSAEDAVFNFITSMIEESKYCCKVIKNSTKCWICDNDYVDNDVKVRDHCHITGKY